MKSEQSIFGYFTDSLSDPTLPKLTYYGKSFSGEEFIDLSLRFGGYLTDTVGQNGTVGIMLPNIPEAVISVYGARAVNVIVNLINPRLPTNNLERVLKKTNTGLLVILDFLYLKHKKMLDGSGVKIVLCSSFAYRKGGLPIYYAERTAYLGKKFFKDTLKYTPCVPVTTDGSSTAVYIHSGGTTGESKTVELSDKALNSLACAVLDTVHPGKDYSEKDDSMLMMLPIFHGFGLGICVHTIMCGFRVVLEPRFKAKEAISIIKREKITHLAGVPSMYAKLIAEPSFDGEHLSSITEAFCGGDGLSPRIKSDFDKIMKKNGSSAELLEGYGLSETASVVTVGANGATKSGSQGTPLTGNAVKIIRADGSEAEVGEVGEIYLSAVSMMSGYLGDGELTRNVIRLGDDGKKWLATGDMGYVDGDEYLFFKERAKRSLKIAAINVFPSEIERTVNAVDGVSACCAARTRDANGKPMVTLYVELSERRGGIEQKIKRAVAREISPYAVPRKIVAVDKIARTSIGKADYLYYESL